MTDGATIFSGALLVGVVLFMLKKQTVAPGTCKDFRDASDTRMGRLEQAAAGQAERIDGLTESVGRLVGNVEPLLRALEMAAKRDERKTEAMETMARDISGIKERLAGLEGALGMKRGGT